MKERNVRMSKHIFYPMINQTLKSLLKIPSPELLPEYFKVVCEFPDYTFSNVDATDPIMSAVIEELRRQYTRWDKGGNNENID